MRTEFTEEQRRDPAIASSEAVIRKCVHCGFCTATCPTYVLLGDELDSPRGRIYLIKDMLENDRAPSAEVVKHVDRCLSCLSCVNTCPSGVNYMHLVDHARVHIEARHRRGIGDRLLRNVLAWTLPRRGRFRAALRLAQIARPFAPLLQRLWHPLGTLLALTPPLLPGRAQSPPSRPASVRGRVVLLQGCAEPVLRPEYRAAATRLLARMGYVAVSVPGEQCCGALAHHLGREEQALADVRANVDRWHAEIEQGLEAIVVTASGCGTVIKDYGFLLRNDPAYAGKAARVSAMARDITEFLFDRDMPAGGPRDVSVAYHPPCSLQHGQGVRDIPIQLLRRAGYRVELPAEPHLCCGSAGTYNILQPEIASELGARKAAALAALDADVIATGNVGCATQIARFGMVPIVHTIELLDWATGGPAPAGLDDLNRQGSRKSAA